MMIKKGPKNHRKVDSRMNAILDGKNLRMEPPRRTVAINPSSDSDSSEVDDP